MLYQYNSCIRWTGFKFLHDMVLWVVRHHPRRRPGLVSPPTGYIKLLLLFWLLSGTLGLNAQNAGGVNTIVIKAVTGLQYDVVRFKVKPGEKVRITLSNEDDMAHNLLIVKPGTRLEVVNTAMQLAEKGPQMNYTPKTGTVLWSIPLISPGQRRSVSFTAPAKPGVYPYVCTFPGHGFVMYGAMYVMQEGNMPDIKKDVNIPEARRQEDKKNKNDKSQLKKDQHTADHQVEASPHPYVLTPPYLYHAFIDGVSPAAVAVRLPKELSYCWDNEACRLGMAWKGGFIDMSDLWKGHFNASAEILGDIFFRDNTDFPIRLGEKATVPAEVLYKGYRLVNEYPEFHYSLDGMEVYELITEKADGNGLIRSFRIPDAGQKLWFFTNRQEDAIEYESSAGRWKDGILELSPAEARSFTITMTSYYLAYKKKK